MEISIYKNNEVAAKFYGKTGNVIALDDTVKGMLRSGIPYRHGGIDEKGNFFETEIYIHQDDDRFARTLIWLLMTSGYYFKNSDLKNVAEFLMNG